MTRRNEPPGAHLSLKPRVVLKNLESPHLYDIPGDELYDLDEEALAYIASSPPVASDGEESAGADVAQFCLDEGLAELTAERRELVVPTRSCAPSLRYLLVHITGRCNLRCRHCFLGDPRREELPLEHLLSLADQFAELQGLRFIVSGGEPLLHRQFFEFNERLPEYPFRSILLTNGTLLDAGSLKKLRFHEVQLSIDGLESSHDLIRGKGNFRKARAALELLASSDCDLSVATMVHRANADELEELGSFLSRYSLRSWSVDVPCFTGNFENAGELAADADAAARAMSHSFGGGYYGSSGDYACGAHLAAVMADGSTCKCGHYAGRSEGHGGERLDVVWRRMKRLRLEDLSCRCSHLRQCRGGCRFRAELSSCLSGPDLIQCLARGVPTGGDLQDDSSIDASGERG